MFRWIWLCFLLSIFSLSGDLLPVVVVGRRVAGLVLRVFFLRGGLLLSLSCSTVNVAGSECGSNSALNITELTKSNLPDWAWLADSLTTIILAWLPCSMCMFLPNGLHNPRSNGHMHVLGWEDHRSVPIVNGVVDLSICDSINVNVLMIHKRKTRNQWLLLNVALSIAKGHIPGSEQWP